MIPFDERIEAAIDEIEERRDWYDREAKRLAATQPELAAQYTWRSYGLNDAAFLIRRARVPHSLRAITDELFADSGASVVWASSTGSTGEASAEGNEAGRSAPDLRVVR